MKKTELKQILKPLIKECIKEVIFDEGVLSNIVSEVAQGLGGNVIVASKQHVVQPEQRDTSKQQEAQMLREQEEARQKIQETRKKMLDAIGKDSYNGVNLFEGTTSPAPESDQGSPLSGVDPSDPGVDVSQIFGGISKNWSRMIK